MIILIASSLLTNIDSDDNTPIRIPTLEEMRYNLSMVNEFIKGLNGDKKLMANYGEDRFRGLINYKKELEERIEKN